MRAAALTTGLCAHCLLPIRRRLNIGSNLCPDNGTIPSAPILVQLTVEFILAYRQLDNFAEIIYPWVDNEARFETCFADLPVIVPGSASPP